MIFLGWGFYYRKYLLLLTMLPVERLVSFLVLFTGDGGYAQSSYLFTPVRDPQTRSEERYNHAHIRTRVVVERLFGIWKRRFPCLSRKLLNKLLNSQIIIAACAVLHNIGRMDNFANFQDDNLPLEVENYVNPNIGDRRGLAIRRAFIERHFN